MQPLLAAELTVWPDGYVWVEAEGESWLCPSGCEEWFQPWAGPVTWPLRALGRLQMCEILEDSAFFLNATEIESSEKDFLALADARGPLFSGDRENTFRAWREEFWTLRGVRQIATALRTRDGGRMRELFEAEEYRGLFLHTSSSIRSPNAPSWSAPPRQITELYAAVQPLLNTVLAAAGSTPDDLQGKLKTAMELMGAMPWEKWTDEDWIEVGTNALEVCCTCGVQTESNLRLRNIGGGRLAFETELKSLSAVIWSQLALYAVGDVNFRQCETCEKWFEVAVGTNRPDRLFCSQGCRFKAYRRRQKQACELHAAGKSIEAIAAELQSDPKTVQGWLSKVDAAV